MINFIPKAFTAEEDGTCPICPVRLKFEAALEVEAALLRQVGSKLIVAGAGETLANAWQAVPAAFAVALADYRVSYSLNLAIWFSAEQFGRAKKVPDLLMAYEEYRTRVGASMAAYVESVKAFIQLASVECVAGPVKESLDALKTSHAELVAANSVAWVELDKWTNGRREEAFKVV